MKISIQKEEKLKLNLYEIEELFQCLKDILEYQSDLGVEISHVLVMTNILKNKITRLCDDFDELFFII